MSALEVIAEDTVGSSSAFFGVDVANGVAGGVNGKVDAGIGACASAVAFTLSGSSVVTLLSGATGSGASFSIDAATKASKISSLISGQGIVGPIGIGESSTS